MPDNATKTVAFLLYPGLTPLDMIGPLQLLNGLGMADPSFRVTGDANRSHGPGVAGT